MKIKKDDNVIVISGKDKGKTGKVSRAFPALDRIIIEGVNIKKRHQRATRQGQKGRIVETAHPIHVSNVKKVTDESTAAPKTRKATTKKVK